MRVSLLVVAMLSAFLWSGCGGEDNPSGGGVNDAIYFEMGEGDGVGHGHINKKWLLSVRCIQTD